MCDSHQGRFRQQVNFLRHQFVQDCGLPFTKILDEKMVIQAVTALGVSWMDRIYSPLVTLWVFLGQVLSSDSSCRAAVARLIAHRVSQRLCACSAKTGAYCQARQRLPEEFFSQMARQTGQALDAQADSSWLWKGRRVYAYDGSTVIMPDTPENQRAYPQLKIVKPGLGFPMARIAAIFSLACGTVLDLGICRYAGKGQSELGMLRHLMQLFRPGDVMVADRLMCAWTELVMLQQRGVDCVCRFTSHRSADFRRGTRLGPQDHIVVWRRPTKPRSMNRTEFQLLPESLTIRECRVRIEHPGFRIKVLVLATTLLDAGKFSKEDLAQLYRMRWNAELDLRSLKRTMQMDMLRCKTPALVRKEIWTHILAYNLIRTIMAQAAIQYGLQPRSVSFKGAIQTLAAFQTAIAIQGERDAVFRGELYAYLLDAIAQHRVADRPNRYEPRRAKLNLRMYGLLKVPRQKLKRLMAEGVIKI